MTHPQAIGTALAALVVVIAGLPFARAGSRTASVDGADSKTMSGLHVVGNQIQNAAGVPVRLVGVNRSSAESIANRLFNRCEFAGAYRFAIKQLPDLDNQLAFRKVIAAAHGISNTDQSAKGPIKGYWPLLDAENPFAPFRQSLSVNYTFIVSRSR